MRDQSRRVGASRARLLDERILLDPASDVARVAGNEAVPARALEAIPFLATLTGRDRFGTDGNTGAGLVGSKVVVAVPGQSSARFLSRKRRPLGAASLSLAVEKTKQNSPLVVLVCARAVLLAADGIPPLLANDAVGVLLPAHEPLLQGCSRSARNLATTTPTTTTNLVAH